MALVSPSLLERAKAANIPTRSGGSRAGPLGDGDVAELGLAPLQEKLSRLAGRPVNFMFFDNASDALSRGPSNSHSPMSKTYALYGLACSSLEEARVLVEHALGVSLKAHESGYRGGEYYRLDNPKGENLILQRNYDEFDDEWAEPAHQDAPFILYVNGTQRHEELRQPLIAEARIIALRHKEL